MNVLFVNPPFKAEYGKYSREARSAMITNSGVVAIKDIATKPLSGDNKYTYPTIDNVVYD